MALRKHIFEEYTTNKNDFQVPLLRKPVRYHEWTRKSEVEEKIIKQKPYIPKEIHSMQVWKDIKQFPLYMYWETKPIIRTHPETTFDRVDEIQDLKKWDVIKTRPRLHMSPAVSMDDVENMGDREILCKYAYTSTQEKAAQDIVWTYTKHDLPNQTFKKKRTPIEENYEMDKYLPADKKIFGKEWEEKQYTALVDPSEAYWTDFYKSCILNKVIPAGRDPFEYTKEKEKTREIKKLIEADELRAEYDTRQHGYTGYYPRNMIGPLRKPELQLKQDT